MAALAAVAVPAPLLVGHHHHHHHKHRPPAAVQHAKPTTPKAAQPTAPKRPNHQLAGLTGKKPSLTLQVTTATHAGHAAGKGSTPAAHAAGDPSDSIVDYKFEPASITIHVGDTITWTNNGQQPHTATANDGSFNTGTIKPGASGSHTFSTAGTFAYICSIHPFMHGTVVVEASSSGNSAGGSGSSGGGSGGGGGSGSSGGGGGSSSPSASTSSSSPSSSGGSTGSGTPSSTSSGTLPNTGLDLSGAVLIALAMIGSGVAIRRRLRQPEPPGQS